MYLGDLSSISGSESSSSPSDEEEGVELKQPGHTHSFRRSSPYLHFSPSNDPVGVASPTHSVYRCIVTANHAPEVGSEVVQDLLRKLEGAQVWIILMRSGGHFAAAVFRG